MHISFDTPESGQYNCQVMAQQIPTQFDPVALCRRTEQGAAAFVGEIDIDNFTRLSEILTEPAGSVAVDLRFQRLESSRPAAHGTLKARLPMTCQRCLTTCWTDVEVEFSCCFASSEAVAERMPEDIDVVMMDEKGKATMSEFFEDELLLACPSFPKHADGECKGEIAERLEDLVTTEEAVVAETNELPTRKALAGLGDLLKQSKQKPKGGN